MSLPPGAQLRPPMGLPAGRVLLVVLTAVLSMVASLAGILLGVAVTSSADGSLTDLGGAVVGYWIGTAVGAAIGSWSAQYARGRPGWRVPLAALLLGLALPLPWAALLNGQLSFVVWIVVGLLTLATDVLVERRAARSSA
ncbi:MAG: hypothetical protein EPO13_01715 [Actinomycetota bacterium]|nr:MAG: hypothetical protein EPO13_01715 [Actinomycetota bacterium]